MEDEQKQQLGTCSVHIKLSPPRLIKKRKSTLWHACDVPWHGGHHPARRQGRSKFWARSRLPCFQQAPTTTIQSQSKPERVSFLSPMAVPQTAPSSNVAASSSSRRDFASPTMFHGEWYLLVAFVLTRSSKNFKFSHSFPVRGRNYPDSD